MLGDYVAQCLGSSGEQLVVVGDEREAGSHQTGVWGGGENSQGRKIKGHKLFNIKPIHKLPQGSTEAAIFFYQVPLTHHPLSLGPRSTVAFDIALWRRVLQEQHGGPRPPAPGATNYIQRMVSSEGCVWGGEGSGGRG